MQLGNVLEYGGNPVEAADLLSAREKAGIDVVWVSEAYGYDSPTLMGYLAAKTERVQIGSAIINVFSRTPAAIAQTVAGLDHVSGGRAILGLGASGPQVIEGFHGVPYRKPLARTREVVDVVRQALRREAPVRLDGETVSIPFTGEGSTGLGKPLKLINRPQRPAVPIFLASIGDKSIETAAEIADGWFPSIFVPELAQKIWQTPLAAGAARRDPSLAPLEITAGGMLAIAEGEERERLLDRGRAQLALYIGGMGAATKNFYNDVFVHYGYADEAKKIQELYLEGRKDEAEATVPRDVLVGMNLIGSEGFVKERIAAFAEAGVTILNVTPLTPDLSMIERVRSWLP
jgi:F420-dependent oxidoreductase-like protein